MQYVSSVYKYVKIPKLRRIPSHNKVQFLNLRVDGMTYHTQSEPLIQRNPTKWGLLASLLALGVLGNYFKYPLFFEIDFLFGSIFSFLIFQLFGKANGIAAAFVVSAVTYFIWGHP